MLPLLVANWKMHKTKADALAFIDELRRLWPDRPGCEGAIAPPFTALDAVGGALRGTAIALAAQNVHWEEEGAFTGEVAARFLADLGCRYVIVGHSERRSQWGETDEQIARKLQTVLAHGMAPVWCIGESLREREAGRVLEVVGRQLAAGLGAVTPARMPPGRRGPELPLVIAYEPVWAIGTGRIAEPKQVQEVHAAVRQWLRDRLGGAADGVRLLYGGSVTPENVAAMAAQPDVNGALVGGASLDAKQFVLLAQRIARGGASS
ncbi:MAG: triose-phosphate isomerase [Nitrospirae bacterium]|nr:triose-phosphate isomerase [Nitrospirota bacterium]